MGLNRKYLLVIYLTMFSNAHGAWFCDSTNHWLTWCVSADRDEYIRDEYYRQLKKPLTETESNPSEDKNILNDDNSTSVSTGDIKAEKVQVGDSKVIQGNDSSKTITTGNIKSRTVDQSSIGSVSGDAIKGENVTVNKGASVKSMNFQNNLLKVILSDGQEISALIPDPDLIAQLERLDVDSLVRVAKIDVSAIEKLSKIDVKSLDKLTSINVNKLTRLTTLDVSKISELTKISIKEIKSKKGKQGEKGDRGNRGIAGIGAAGKDGKDGKDGEDGEAGVAGKDGTDGKDGADGVTPRTDIFAKVESLEGLINVEVLNKELDDALVEYARKDSLGHGHSASEVTTLVSRLNFLQDHTHDLFSLSTHDHDDKSNSDHDHDYSDLQHQHNTDHNHDENYSLIHFHPFSSEDHGHTGSASSNHDHDANYASIHNHPYSTDSHSHDTEHDHNELYALNHQHPYSDGSHNHDSRYSVSLHGHSELQSIEHDHSWLDILNRPNENSYALVTDLAETSEDLMHANGVSPFTIKSALDDLYNINELRNYIMGTGTIVEIMTDSGGQTLNFSFGQTFPTVPSKVILTMATANSTNQGKLNYYLKRDSVTSTGFSVHINDGTQGSEGMYIHWVAYR